MDQNLAEIPLSVFLERNKDSLSSKLDITKIRCKIIANNEEGYKEAGRLLREGKLVAFPTETVYGLGANSLNENAVLKIYEAKSILHLIYFNLFLLNRSSINRSSYCTYY